MKFVNGFPRTNEEAEAGARRLLIEWARRDTARKAAEEKAEAAKQAAIETDPEVKQLESGVLIYTPKSTED